MRLGLRARLTALFLLLALGPLGLAGWLFYRTASQALLLRSEEQLTSLTQLTADQVAVFFRDRRASLDLLAETPFIQLAFLAHEFNQSLHEVRAKLHAFRKKEPYYHRIALYDVNGEAIVSFPEPLGATRASTSWFNVAADHDAYASDLAIVDGRPSVILTKAVYDFELPGRRVGTLLFDVDFGALTGLLDKVRPARTAVPFLLDGRGIVYVHPDVARLGRPWADSVSQRPQGRGDEALTALSRRMLAGEAGFASYREAGHERFVAHAPVPKKDWVVAVSIERNDLMADVLAFERRMLTLGLGTLALGMVAALGVAQWLSRPIRALTRGAAAIARGEWDQRIAIRRHDEIGQLAATFNHMAGTIRETSARLVQRERLAVLGELATAIAHEVRNPLAGLKTSLQVLARRAGSREVAEFGADVQKEVDRLNALVSSLLDYARPAPANRSAVSIPAILDTALRLVRKSCARQNIAVVSRVEPSTPLALADAQQMEQVFLNVLLNATKAMPDGGTLTVACRGVATDAGARVEVAVADSGKGIAEDALPRIFEPFFTTSPQGTGLGLAIVQKLLQENAGTIAAGNRTEGGAEFVIQLEPAPRLP